MAYLGDFDANKVEPNEPLQPIPAGTYLAVIESTADKDNKNGNGRHLELIFRVMDGQCKGRTVRERLNIWHTNDTPRRIAEGDLSAICRAVGVMKPRDSNALTNLPLEIAVAVSNPDAEGRMYNEIKGYAKRGASATPPPSANGNAATAALPGGPKAPAAASAPAETPGWLQ